MNKVDFKALTIGSLICNRDNEVYEITSLNIWGSKPETHIAQKQGESFRHKQIQVDSNNCRWWKRVYPA